MADTVPEIRCPDCGASMPYTRAACPSCKRSMINLGNSSAITPKAVTLEIPRPSNSHAGPQTRRWVEAAVYVFLAFGIGGFAFWLANPLAAVLAVLLGSFLILLALAAVGVINAPAAATRGQVSGNSSMRCTLCGHLQTEGEWERAMDAQARARGSEGFVNLGARPQCLKCGSRELTNVSRARPNTARDLTDADAERRKHAIDRAANEIVGIMEPYFRTGTWEIGAGHQKLERIGRELNAVGGRWAMRKAYDKAQDLAHRRFGYAGSLRLLEMDWNGIGEWMG